MGELKLIKSIVFFGLYFQFNGILSDIPNSPCPNIFEYVPNDSEYYGKLNLDTKWHSHEIKIKVNLSIPSLVEFGPEDSRGNIEFLNGRDNAIADIKAGTPIQYKVNFPKACVPEIEEIIVNDENICNGTINKNPVNTKILLQHTMRLLNVQPPFETYSFDKNSSRIKARDVSSMNNDEYAVYNDYKGSNSEPFEQTCGKLHSSTSSLIVGGEVTRPNSWPWLAAIYYNVGDTLSFRCGGSLITEHLIITAAHCFNIQNTLVDPNKVVIILGKYNLLNWDEPNSKIINADQVVSHPDYRFNEADADIAIVIMKKKVIFTNTIQPICQWTASNSEEFVQDLKGTVVGWGKNENGQNTALQKSVDVTIESELACRLSNPTFSNLITNKTICVRKSNSVGPCSGNSGSGLMIYKDGYWYLRGIVSTALAYDSSKCNLNEYGIYLDIAKFHNWIMKYY